MFIALYWLRGYGGHSTKESRLDKMPESSLKIQQVTNEFEIPTASTEILVNNARETRKPEMPR